MLEYWALIEADFFREYNIRLVDEIGNLTWRLFINLVNGLSADSRWMSVLRDAPVYATPEQAERFLDS